MDWFKGNFTGKTHIQWENLWFPVDFPLNQSIDKLMTTGTAAKNWDAPTEEVAQLGPSA